MKKIKIFCTLGPSSLNPNFLRQIKGKIDLIRLNMSHVKLNELKKNINFIRKFTKTAICIDTEGAQIRTKVNSKKFYKQDQKLRIFNKKKIKLYPPDVFYKLKVGDILEIGFEGLRCKLIKKNNKEIVTKVLKSGFLEGNKGVYVSNRNIKLNFITKKDEAAIKIGKEMRIKNYALSFVNNKEDIIKFNKILPKENKIFKIETKAAMKNLKDIIRYGNQFLIDRGDLSKEILIEQIPIAQRKILNIAKKKNKRVYIATNFLESMILHSYPTRAEVNDIFNALELGSSGIVLAAETAIGKYPLECINLLKKIIKTFKFYKKNNPKQYG